jgi:hypothetical protein
VRVWGDGGVNLGLGLSVLGPGSWVLRPRS